MMVLLIELYLFTQGHSNVKQFQLIFLFLIQLSWSFVGLLNKLRR